MKRADPIMERKINRFLEKRGMKQQVADYWKIYNNIDKALKDGRTTLQELKAGEAPEDIKNDFIKMHQLGYVLGNTYNKHAQEIVKTKGHAKLKEEFDLIDKEVESEIQREAFIAEGKTKLDTAKTQYEMNPTSENMRKIITEELRLREHQAEPSDSPVALGQKALRQKLFDESVRAKKEGKKLKAENPGQYLDISDRTSHNEERIRFEEVTAAAANEPEPAQEGLSDEG